jgi:ATP-dependent Zn protease
MHWAALSQPVLYVQYGRYRTVRVQQQQAHTTGQDQDRTRSRPKVKKGHKGGKRKKKACQKEAKKKIGASAQSGLAASLPNLPRANSFSSFFLSFFLFFLSFLFFSAFCGGRREGGQGAQGLCSFVHNQVSVICQRFIIRKDPLPPSPPPPPPG